MASGLVRAVRRVESPRTTPILWILSSQAFFSIASALHVLGLGHDETQKPGGVFALSRILCHTLGARLQDAL